MPSAGIKGCFTGQSPKDGLESVSSGLKRNPGSAFRFGPNTRVSSTEICILFEGGLQLQLRTQAVSPQRARVRPPVFKEQGGLVKGINPLSKKALLEALDDDA